MMKTYQSQGALQDPDVAGSAGKPAPAHTMPTPRGRSRHLRSAALIAVLCVSGSALAQVTIEAPRGGWRTSEKQLHLLALLGGWPAAWWAQQRLRHKSSKPEFRRVYWATIVLNCAALGFVLGRAGLLAGALP